MIVNKEKDRVHIQIVIFDLGGVLIDWNPRYLYRKLMKSEAEIEHFLSHICTPAWNAQQDAGRPFHEGVTVLIKQYPQYRELIEAYHQRWEETLGDALWESVEIFRQIKSAGLPVYALTNWSAETFPYTRKRFSFLHEFDGIVVSGEEKVAKPEARLFHILLERYKIEASTALYIDDNADNIATAKQLGLHSIHFQNAPQLRQALQELKVL
ncbi:MAG: HAD family hydrolase [bacterium]